MNTWTRIEIQKHHKKKTSPWCKWNGYGRQCPQFEKHEYIEFCKYKETKSNYDLQSLDWDKCNQFIEGTYQNEVLIWKVTWTPFLFSWMVYKRIHSGVILYAPTQIDVWSHSINMLRRNWCETLLWLLWIGLISVTKTEPEHPVGPGSN